MRTLSKLFLATMVLFCMPMARADLPKASPAPTFRRIQIKLGKFTLNVEVADNDELRERGLMFRKELAKDEGMLFVFDEDAVRNFWMMNTEIPLALAYFNGQKKLINILEMEPAAVGDQHPPVYASKGPARYALEMNRAWFSKNHIAPGARFSYVEAK